MIPTTDGVIPVRVVEFASIPDVEGGAARMMLLVDEPVTRRMFVNEMRGPLFTVSYDGRTVTQYLDINAPRWNVGVQSMGRERGFQSFAVHPQFGRAGTPGLRQAVYLDRHDQYGAHTGLPARRWRARRTRRCCSSGRPRTPQRRPTTAVHRVSCFGSSSRSPTITAAT